MSYRVYLLRNLQEKSYIGISEDVQHRLEQHNSGESRWTKGKGPWSLVWTSKVMTLSDARKLENKLKRQKGGSGKLFSAFTAHNPAAAGS